MSEKRGIRNLRAWIALLVWLASSCILALGMEGFAEPHESFSGILLFAAAVSLALHAAFFVVTVRPDWLRISGLKWIIALGLMPASFLILTVIAGTAPKLPSQFGAFGVAVAFLLLYTNAWRLLVQRIRRSDTPVT